MYAIFCNGSRLDLFLSNSETTQCENYFSTNLVTIHEVVIEVMAVSCFVLFLSNSKWWPSWSVLLQNIEMASCNNCSGTKLDQFQ